jgi:hypothetical protein
VPLFSARTRCEKLPPDFIEKLPASIIKISKDAFKGTHLHDQCVTRHCELFRKYGVVREQYTLDDKGKLVFKEGVETIKRVFREDMEQILEVILPEGVKTIAEGAFGCDQEQKGGCVELAKVSMPATLEEIGDGAFLRCVPAERALRPTT